MDGRMYGRMFQKTENRGIKIARVNSILMTKSHNLQSFILICRVSWVRCDVEVFKLTVNAQYICKKVSASHHQYEDALI